MEAIAPSLIYIYIYKNGLLKLQHYLPFPEEDTLAKLTYYLVRTIPPFVIGITHSHKQYHFMHIDDPAPMKQKYPSFLVKRY